MSCDWNFSVSQLAVEIYSLTLASLQTPFAGWKATWPLPSLVSGSARLQSDGEGQKNDFHLSHASLQILEAPQHESCPMFTSPPQSSWLVRTALM